MPPESRDWRLIGLGGFQGLTPGQDSWNLLYSQLRASLCGICKDLDQRFSFILWCDLQHHSSFHGWVRRDSWEVLRYQVPLRQQKTSGRQCTTPTLSPQENFGVSRERLNSDA